MRAAMNWESMLGRARTILSHVNVAEHLENDFYASTIRNGWKYSKHFLNRPNLQCRGTLIDLWIDTIVLTRSLNLGRKPRHEHRNPPFPVEGCTKFLMKLCLLSANTSKTRAALVFIANTTGIARSLSHTHAHTRSHTYAEAWLVWRAVATNCAAQEGGCEACAAPRNC